MAPIRRPYNGAILGALENMLSLLGQYGYLVVFFGVMLESCGVPLPGETILVASGVLVHRGALDPGDAIAFGILGDQIGYWVGRGGGRPFVLRWGRYVLVTPERLGRAEAFFARHGGKAVFLARFVAGLRVFGAPAAGMSRMSWRTFSSTTPWAAPSGRRRPSRWGTTSCGRASGSSSTGSGGPLFSW